MQRCSLYLQPGLLPPHTPKDSERSSGSPFLTLIFLATLAVLDTVEGMQAGAVGSFTLVLTVAVGLSSHRDGARDGGREGGKLRLRI